MVSPRESHTFIVRHVPPEGDILRDDEVRELGESGEGGLVAALFEHGIRMLHNRFRKRFARALARMLPVPVAEEGFESEIHDGALTVRLTCSLAEDEVEPVNDGVSKAVKRTWERVANA